MNGWWWVSSERMTFGVEVRDGNIVASAPIGRNFVGQTAKNLGAWMRSQGGFKAQKLPAAW